MGSSSKQAFAAQLYVPDVCLKMGKGIKSCLSADGAE